MNDLTKAEIKKRLRAAGLSWACSWDGDGEVLPREEHVAEADYDAAAAIVADTLAEGERRFKTPAEFWATFASLPAEAQQAALTWTTILLFRETAIRNPQLADEIMQNAAWQLAQTAPAVYAELAADGRLTFEATTVDG